MLSRQALMRVGAFGEAPPKILRPSCLQATHQANRRPLTRTLTLDIRTRAYDDDNDDYGRGSRGGRSRQGGGDQRRQRGGRSRNFEDEDEWASATPLDGSDSRGFSEEITLEGGKATTAATPSGAGAGYENGRSYGRGGGGGEGYERRGGGRGYSRGGGGRGGGGERRWGGEQQAGGEGLGGEAAAGASEGGERTYRPRGEYQGQGGRGSGRGRGGGGGRGAYGRGYGSTAEGVEGGEGQQRWTYRGPRDGLSDEARATRQATNDAVREANDWRSLAAVLESRSGSLDAENIASMMYKISRREARFTYAADSAAFESFVASLYGWVSALASSLRPRQVATCIHAMARLELFNAELVGALAERAKPLMGNFSSWEYSNMVWAFSRMNFTPGDEWLQQFCYWSQRELPNFKPLELSNTITGLARLGHVPEATWLEAFAGTVAKQSTEFSMVDTVNTLFSLGSLGYNGGPDAQSWLEPLLTASPSTPGGQQYQQYSAAGSSSQGGGGYGSIESLRLAELTRLTWALTQFNWRPPAGWLRGAVRTFVSQLRYATPSDLSTISYSLAYLRAAPSPDELGLLASALTKCWGRLAGDELANVAMSLALWQYRCPGSKEAADRWLDEFVLAIRVKLPECSPDGLSKVVSALPLLGSGYRLNMTVNAAQDLLSGPGPEEQQAGEEAEEEEAQDEAMAAV